MHSFFQSTSGFSFFPPCCRVRIFYLPHAMSDFLASTTRTHLQREEAIGATRRIVDLSQASPPAVNSSPAPRPVVSLKTLYTDFEVRELPAFYGNGAPLQLELAETSSSNGEAKQSVASDAELPRAEGAGAKRSRDEHDHSTPVSTPDNEVVEKTASTATPPLFAVSAVSDTIGPLVSAEDLAALLAGLAAEAKSIPLPSVVEKEKRGQLHAAIKACLGTTHVSNTVNGAVCVVKANAADRREERRRSRVNRPPPSYHHFTLYKENTDSNQALRMIAAHLRLSTRQLQFCGTKDKRAVTLQRVAVRETTVERLRSINDRSFGQHNVVKVCGFTQESHGLRLGDAKGNHFRIALRVFPDTSSAAAGAAAVTADFLQEVERVVRVVGVINYFGPQRFGTTAVLTSDVGVQFLRGRIAEGLRLLLASKATIVPELTKAVELFEARNYAEALQAAPYFCYQERDVLKHLCSNPNDFLGALQSMPRTMAMLYFHAVQSLVWNRMASARLSGPERVRVEVGDLVLETAFQARLKGTTKQEEEEGSTTTNADATGDEGDAAELDTDAKLAAVHKLATEDECALFTLADVMLPVPGPDQELIYPESAGCTRADYDRVLQEMEVDFAAKEAMSLIKIFHFHGTYRALGVKPKDFALSLHTATSWRAPVLHSDWETHCERHDIARPSGAVTEQVAASEPQGAIQVVVASFSLPPGSYATSVLREFCMPSTEGFHSTEAAPGE